MDIKTLAQKEQAYMVALRREFHKHPEVSFEEKWTSERIKKELDSLGIPYEGAGDYGIVATIEGQKKDVMVALRADMDALPIHEENTHLDYISTIPKVMHACGHDAHVAMLLGAAKVLLQIKDQLKGSVKLCFQQAEERGGGAKEILAVLDKYPIKTAFGIHIWSGVPSGKVSLVAGPRMSGGKGWLVRFKGLGTHGAIPEDGISPILAAASFVLNLNSAWAYEFSPLENVAATTGRIQAGQAPNVIPEIAEVAGTIRTFTPEQRTKMEGLITRMAEHCASLFRLQWEVEMDGGVPPVFNDVACTALAQECALKISGGEDILDPFHPLMPSENYGFYVEKYPGLMAFVGGGCPEKECTYAHHHPRFNIDEDAFTLGAALHAQYTVDFLNKY